MASLRHQRHLQKERQRLRQELQRAGTNPVRAHNRTQTDLAFDDSYVDEPNEKFKALYTLSFEYVFEHENDTVFFSHFAPYSYTDVQNYLVAARRTTPHFERMARVDSLCTSTAGNHIYLLTITDGICTYFTERDEIRLFREGGALPSSFKKRLQFFSNSVQSKCTRVRLLRRRSLAWRPHGPQREQAELPTDKQQRPRG